MARRSPEMGRVHVPSDNEQKEGFLLSIWQAITLVGDVRERSDEIDTSELETVLAEAESLLIDAVSEVAQRPAGPARQRRWLRFWKPAHDTPSGDVSWSGVTSVIPFPGAMTLEASSSRFGKSTAPKTGKTAEISQPARFPLVNPGKRETGPPSFRSRSGSIGRQVRLLVLVVLAVLPMIALQAWQERQLRNERQEVVRERVVYRVQQLAADIGELREGARQLLLAIAQLEAVKLRQPEACFALLAKLRSRYPNYSLLAAADAEGRIFCASGPTVASVADQSFFRRAIGHDGLVVGDYWVDPASGQKVINFAQQFDDSNGRLAGVIFAGLDLTWLSDHLKGNGLTPTSSKLIADRRGNIIARLPHPEEFIGKNMRGSHDSIMEGGEAGWEEVTGVDGVTRVFGYVPSSLPPRDFFLSIGEAKTESFAAINSATWHDAARILAGLLASICIAWAGRNLVFGTAQALRQSTADHRQPVRQHPARLASPCGLLAILPGEQASFIVRQTITRLMTGRRTVWSTSATIAGYSARGPPAP
jgi:Cache domain